MSLKVDIQYQHCRQQSGEFKLACKTEISLSGVTAIYGHSGAGKTSLLRCIAGLENPSASSLFFNDTPWLEEQNGKPLFIAPEKRKIGYIFQDTQLFSHLTVSENLDFAHQRRFKSDGLSTEEVISWLNISSLLSQYPHELSGGETQRVAIARTLLSSPQLLLMDEPLGALDSQAKKEIIPYLVEVRRKLDIPIIFVSHSLEEVCELADNLILMDRGEIKNSGPLIDMLTEVDSSLAHEESASSILECQIQSHDEQYQLTKLRLGIGQAIANIPKDGQHLYTSLIRQDSDSNLETTLRVRIPARDISIALDNHEDTSILNKLSGTIDKIEQCSAAESDTNNGSSARVLVRVNVNGQMVLVRITRKSLDKLELVKGQQVYIQIKSVALMTAG